jgi:hypothetical protein
MEIAEIVIRSIFFHSYLMANNFLFTIKISTAIKINEMQVAQAAPTIPYSGINNKLRIILDTAPKPLIHAINPDLSNK